MILLYSLACAPDDVTDEPVDDTGAGDTDTGDTDTGDTDTGGNGGDSLVGSWLSDGENICALLAGDPFNYVEILADFAEDGSYVVGFTNVDGQQGSLTGTYVTDTSTTPGTIVLSQATPYTATAEGIWQVESDVLTYEVAQTKPDYGFVPPTPEEGFGSTTGQGLEAGVNVQVYVRR